MIFGRKNKKSKKKSSRQTRRAPKSESLIRQIYGALFLGWRKYALLIAVCTITIMTASDHGVLKSLPSNIENRFIQITADNGFTVQYVKVEGRHHVPSETILAIINVQPGDPIFGFSPKSAQDMIGKLKWVKSARVERHLPDTIFIELTERRPVFLWQKQGELHAIDENGDILPEEAVKLYKDRPILIGTKEPEKIKQAYGIIDNHALLQPIIEAIVWIGDRRWDLKLKNGIRIKLPEDDFTLALQRLENLNKEEDILSKDLQMIDLRNPDKTILRPSRRANLLIDRPDVEQLGDNAI